MAWAPAIMFAREVAGRDRVLYAMDYPFQAEASEVKVHEDLPISADDKRYLFEEGATTLFGLTLERT
jgi:2,3-dihydroxybenzoate decarboxylase